MKARSMDTGRKSLRMLIEKWFAPTIPVRVTRFSRIRSTPRRYVCVEASGQFGPLAIFFFRHDDGAWCVFPPEANRPAMRVTSECGAIDVSARPSSVVRHK